MCMSSFNVVHKVGEKEVGEIEYGVCLWKWTKIRLPGVTLFWCSDLGVTEDHFTGKANIAIFDEDQDKMRANLCRSSSPS